MKIEILKTKEIDRNIAEEIAETDIVNGYILVFPKDKENLGAAEELFTLVEGSLAILNIVDEVNYYGVLIGY